MEQTDLFRTESVGKILIRLAPPVMEPWLAISRAVRPGARRATPAHSSAEPGFAYGATARCPSFMSW